MLQPIDFDKLIDIRFEENFREVLLNFPVDIENPESDLRKSIEKKAESLLHMPAEEIVEEIKRNYKAGNYILLRVFIPDPKKQNACEKEQLKFIECLPVIESVYKFSSQGKNAYYVTRDGIVKGTKKPGIKSLDFYWEYAFKGNKLKFYTSAKCTGVRGGAQDNQKNDAAKVLKRAMNFKDKNIFVLAITDGNYYKEPVDGSCQLDILNADYKGPQCAATTSYDLQFLLPDIIEKWLRSLDCDGVEEEIKRVRQAFETAEVAEGSYIC